MRLGIRMGMGTRVRVRTRLGTRIGTRIRLTAGDETDGKTTGDNRWRCELRRRKATRNFRGGQKKRGGC